MEDRTILDEFKEIAESPFSYLRNWKLRSGKKILGYFCTNTPEEIIQAAGLLPMRILNSRESISLASRHLQSYSCSLVQSSLEAGLRGELSFLDGTVFPHTCDSIQRLSDIWAENLRFPFHWDLILPVKLNTASARTYLIQELRRWRLGLQEFIGHSISNEALRDAIALSNKNRSLLRKLYFLRTQNPNYFSPSEVSAIVKTASFMDKEEFNAKLRQLLSRGAESRPASPETIRLFLVGSLCDQTRVFDLFDICGAAIAGDDLCTGWRFFADDASAEGDPLEALADRLLRKVPCPCKYNPGIDRGEYLLQRVEESRARGVVFLLLKFCDPHAFDYPYLKERLAERKILSLLLEFEPGSIPMGAMETRLKAFVETLGG